MAPNQPGTVYRLASLYESLSDSSRARSLYRDFLQLVAQSNRADAFFMRQKARALYRTGSDNQALAVLETARARYPFDFEIINDYAEVLIYQKRYEQALALLDQMEAMKQKVDTGG